MITLNVVWGAVGCAIGVCFASVVITLEIFLEDLHKQKRR